jgi:succinyl-CoA synthetase beta subunit
VFTLTEDLTKTFLRQSGLPVPDGRAFNSAENAGAFAQTLSDGAVVKALVPTGRRGKAGAVKVVNGAVDALEAAKAMLGTEVQGFPVEQVYVEAKVVIAREFYLSFTLDGFPGQILLSAQGGVDIEETHKNNPAAIIRADIDPLCGVSEGQASDLWAQAGLDGEELARVSAVTSALYQAFVGADAVMMEINPLVIDTSGSVSVVGAMMGIDENGLPRHSEWAALGDGSLIAAWRQFNQRELSVAEANRKIKGGAVRYTELDGDIALLVGGGGAGLLQHDMMLALGGRPANHTDTNPGAGIEEKFKVTIRAILDNPAVKCLLVSFNHQQLTHCARKAEPLAEVLRERNVDTEKFPIIVRLVGPGEEEAKAILDDFPGLIYLPFDASLDDAVKKAVDVRNAMGAAA